jgi:uncharacterized protein (TIGR02597 family)
MSLRTAASLRHSISVALTLALPLALQAQEARSRPVGYLTQTIPTGQTRSFSIPFDADVSSLPSAVGQLTAVGANYLENSAATWTPGAFSTPEAPYFVRLTSGAHSGRTFRIITPANTATRIYVADDGLGLESLALTTGAGGTRFEIIPGDTLATFFGTGNELVVHGASQAAQADLVQVWGGAAWLNFYYNTTWNRWARDTDTISDPSRNHFLLRPDRGLMLTRRGTTPLELLVAGRVLTTPQRAYHARTDNALTFLATMQARQTTLGELALQSPARALNWRGSTEPTDADLLIVWSGATWFSFYYHTGNARWQRVGDPENRDTYVIQAGTPVFVQRRGNATTANDKTIAFPASL